MQKTMQRMSPKARNGLLEAEEDLSRAGMSLVGIAILVSAITTANPALFVGGLTLMVDAADKNTMYGTIKRMVGEK